MHQAVNNKTLTAFDAMQLTAQEKQTWPLCWFRLSHIPLVRYLPTKHSDQTILVALLCTPGTCAVVNFSCLLSGICFFLFCFASFFCTLSTLSLHLLSHSKWHSSVIESVDSESKGLGSNPHAVTYQLCDFEQVT